MAPSGRNSRRPAPVDYATLAHCAAALSAVAVPARVENVAQTGPTTLVLALRTLVGTYRLTLSFSQAHGRLTLVDPGVAGGGDSGGGRNKRGKPPASKYTLASTAKALLQSCALVSVSIAAPFERIAKLDFAPTPSDPACAHIFLELLGNGRSNLALTDGALSIKAAGRQVASRTAARALQTGLEWKSPPPPRGMHPADPTVRETLARIAAEQPDALLGETLVRSVAGVSPAAARLICAQRAVESRLSALGAGDVDHIATALAAWFAAHDRVDRVRVLSSRDGEYTLAVVDSVVDAAENALSSGRAIERHYGGLEAADEVADRVKRMRKLLESRVSRERARAAVHASKVLECGSVGQLKRDAEFLYSYAHSWSPGDEFVSGEWASGGTAVDVLETVKVRMPDDKAVSPVEYGKRLYRRAGKLERAHSIAESRCREAEAEVAWLEGVSVSLDMVRTVDDMSDLEAEVAEAAAAAVSAAGGGNAAGAKMTSRSNGKRRAGGGARVAAQRPPRQQKGQQQRRTTATTGVLRVSASLGGDSIEVLVGRNAKGNESVTFEMARKDDLWLHVAGAPGSHVLVRQSGGGGGPVDDGCVQFAANYAAFFSKSASSANVPVNVLRAAHVRRAPGTPRRVGSVILTGNSIRTVYARPLDVREHALEALAAAASAAAV
jgi:predicted ribosome quality control (RQC) complex YloA/Tae2 family protein